MKSKGKPSDSNGCTRQNLALLFLSSAWWTILRKGCMVMKPFAHYLPNFVYLKCSTPAAENANGQTYVVTKPVQVRYIYNQIPWGASGQETAQLLETHFQKVIKIIITAAEVHLQGSELIHQSLGDGCSSPRLQHADILERIGQIRGGDCLIAGLNVLDYCKSCSFGLWQMR